jgi:DnaK suppressor protein
MAKNRNLDIYRKELRAMRARLDQRASSLRGEAFHSAGRESTGDLSNAPSHLADRSNQEAESVVNIGLAENEAALRLEIDEAIARLDDGTYGVCEECGGEIAPERLEALPYSRLCIQCAKQRG